MAATRVKNNQRNQNEMPSLDSPEKMAKAVKAIGNAKDLDKVMSVLDPSSKDGPLLLQALGQSGKQSVVDSYTSTEP